jgi:hypothetical protein
MAKPRQLKDLKDLLHTGGYFPAEIERVLDPKVPCFVKFDPVLGYELKDYIFNDGVDGTLSSYVYHKHGGHRKMVNYADQPCRLNTYGDSYTQCAQVSDGETWQEILAARFREPIRNFGVGGYGVYQAYRRALRTEAIKDLAAEYIILNIWDDDYMRNIDAARWVRVAWMCRDLPRGKKGGYPVHGFPWAHVRFNLKTGKWEERDGFCKKGSDLRKLVGPENFYNVFKDDEVAHLYALRQGGDAPVGQLEELGEAFGLKVNLRNPRTRQADAAKLHVRYGIRSTEFIVDQFRRWARANGRKFMVLLSYDVPTVQNYLARGTRFDEEFVKFLKDGKYLYVDFLPKSKEEFQSFKGSINDFCMRFYVARAGAQVFGHYNPYGNFWFAQSLRPHLVEWLNPKPVSYRI